MAFEAGADRRPRITDASRSDGPKDPVDRGLGRVPRRMGGASSAGWHRGVPPYGLNKLGLSSYLIASLQPKQTKLSLA
jgi:hypothetical protein